MRKRGSVDKSWTSGSTCHYLGDRIPTLVQGESKLAIQQERADFRVKSDRIHFFFSFFQVKRSFWKVDTSFSISCYRFSVWQALSAIGIFALQSRILSLKTSNTVIL